MSLNNQTNRNSSRYFFATSENGEQQLGLQYGTTGGSPSISTMAVTITGSQGNGVVVNLAPAFGATEYVFGEQSVFAGSGSSYFTPSTLIDTVSGINLSTDRVPGSGIACIESYGTNGTFGGFEFLNRGVNAMLLSTNSVGINDLLSTSLGKPGAAASLNPAGVFVTNALWGSTHASVDYATGGGGRPCFNIEDLSGVNTLNRWSIGTAVPPAGGNTGSDLAIFSYADGGNFLDTPMTVRRSDGAVAIQNISSIKSFNGTNQAPVFPASKTNTEFGAEGKTEILAGATSNAALYGSPWAPLFSTPLTGLNPNLQTFVSINWVDGLSSGSNHVNYKVGFSTATAFTNTLITSYVPGSGGTWTGSDIPGATSPLGGTLVTCCLDPDGIASDGTATLYVQGQFSDPAAPADQIFIAKGLVTEATRSALVWRPF
jgi:hypothetical protein